MWVMTLDEAISCTRCNHAIFEGEPCFSSVPAQIPEGVRREKYPHFHVNCPGCASETSCYETYASSRPTFAMRGKPECAYCGHSIPSGHRAVRDDRYFLEYGGGRQRRSRSAFQAIINRRTDSTAGFQNISRNLAGKFRRAGLGGKRGIRNNIEAEQFYNSSIPVPVRNLGEGAVRSFTKGKQASHIESVANAPGKAKISGNTIWESAGKNIRRGSKNMTKPELIGANIKNAAQTAGIVAKGAAVSGARGGAISALIELPVSAAENVILAAKGGKSVTDAARDTAADTAKAGVAGGVVAGGLYTAAALGAGTTIAAVAPVAAVVGTGVFGVSTYLRVRRAMKDARVGWESLCFHAECTDCDADHICYQLFVAEMGLYALDNALKHGFKSQRQEKTK